MNYRFITKTDAWPILFPFSSKSHTTYFTIPLLDVQSNLSSKCLAMVSWSPLWIWQGMKKAELTFHLVVHLTSKVGNAKSDIMDVLGFQESLVVGMDTVQFLQHGEICPLEEGGCSVESGSRVQQWAHYFC